jgi:hypothetical protein
VAPNPPQPPGNEPRAPARHKRLAELKRQIQSGEYESAEKLDLTLRRMLPELRGLAGQGASRGDETGGESP